MARLFDGAAVGFFGVFWCIHTPPQPTNQPLSLNLAGIMLMNAGKSGENKERYATIQEQENGVALLV